MGFLIEMAVIVIQKSLEGYGITHSNQSYSSSNLRRQPSMLAVCINNPVHFVYLGLRNDKARQNWSLFCCPCKTDKTRKTLQTHMVVSSKYLSRFPRVLKKCHVCNDQYIYIYDQYIIYKNYIILLYICIYIYYIYIIILYIYIFYYIYYIKTWYNMIVTSGIRSSHGILYMNF